MTDGQLLDAYVTRGDQAAFSELVARHVAWVHSSSLRQVRDPGQAEDVTQAVFILLARKAPGLRSRASVTPWLFSSLRYCATAARRSEGRRKKHETKAASMQPLSTHDETGPTRDDAWDQMADRLDPLLAKLGGADRQAVLLRFFEKKSFTEVAAALGTSEDAAKKRVSRAVDKLREMFAREGVVLSSAAVLAAMEHHAVTAHGTTSLASQIASGALNATTATASAPLAIANGAAGLMTWGTVKLVSGCAAALLLAAGATVMIARSTTAPAADPAPAPAAVKVAVATAPPASQPTDAVPDRSTPASLMRRMYYAVLHGNKAMVEDAILTRTDEERQFVTAMAENAESMAQLRDAAVAQFGPDGKSVVTIDPPGPNLMTDDKWKVDGDRATAFDRGGGPTPTVAVRQPDGTWRVDLRASVDRPNSPFPGKGLVMQKMTALHRDLTARIVAGEFATAHDAAAAVASGREQFLRTLNAAPRPRATKPATK